MNWTTQAIFSLLLFSSLTHYTMAGNRSLATVLRLFLVLTLFHNPITVDGQSIPAVALFTFGDSNFDAGNKQSLTKANVAQCFWPYGKSRDDPNGKFSDGFIAPDFVGTFKIFITEVNLLNLHDPTTTGIWLGIATAHDLTFRIVFLLLVSWNPISTLQTRDGFGYLWNERKPLKWKNQTNIKNWT